MKKIILNVLICSLLFINESNKSLLAKEFLRNKVKIEIPTLTNQYKEIANFIAGIDLPDNSELIQLTKRKDYIQYKVHIEEDWNKFFISNSKLSREWSDKFLPRKYSSLLFYPFSGPDILHPLIFYPEGSDIIMFGLEPIGVIPDPITMNKDRVVRDLWALPSVLNFTLKHAFFVTLEMGKKVGINPYTGITGVMLFFLAKGGYDVLYVKKIWLNLNSDVVTLEPPVKEKNIPGVEIIFRRSGEENLKRARYFRLDISDGSPKLPLLSAFIEKNNDYTTIIKSASYLMYISKGFSKIRDLILNRSHSVLQDDSGMPLKSFDENIWNISYHGYYHKPILDFKMFYQKDLNDKLKKYSTGTIPFVYGYGYGYNDMTYHLTYAEKK